MPRPPLVAPGRRPVALRPVRPNAGLAALYRKRLVAEIDRMERDVVRTIGMVWRDDPPRMAQDASPAAALRAALASLRRRWEKGFADLAESWGRRFAGKAVDGADRSLRAALKKAGFTVEFTMTPQVRDVFAATLNEQVSLIRSIPEQCLTQVASMVNVAVQTGHDLGTLTKGLEKQFGVSRHRAALIARDQSSKATATITRARQQELGINRAKWLHSAGGKVPRPEHVAFSKGTHRGGNHGPFYDVAKGAFLEGKWTWPGVEINCRCVSIPVIPGQGGWRDAV